MIPASGAGGPGFNPRLDPCFVFLQSIFKRKSDVVLRVVMQMFVYVTIFAEK